ncbi:MAG: hypothetical protein U9Q66_00530 [Patescibacteria group bacterium]|nr:hypothetical protein [Patescibacteria group bacterium]
MLKGIVLILIEITDILRQMHLHLMDVLGFVIEIDIINLEILVLRILGFYEMIGVDVQKLAEVE